jgi:hypothetical protein
MGKPVVLVGPPALASRSELFDGLVGFIKDEGVSFSGLLQPRKNRKAIKDSRIAL